MVILMDNTEMAIFKKLNIIYAVCLQADNWGW